MKARPILFSDEMVRALLDGRKTQTRRLVPGWQLPKECKSYDKRFPENKYISIAQRHRKYGFGVFGETEEKCMNNLVYASCCPCGNTGDYLYVKESYAPLNNPQGAITGYIYSADYPNFSKKDGRDWNWKSGRFMPKTASRLTLQITHISVERVQDITELDAISEGCPGDSWFIHPQLGYTTEEGVLPTEEYEELWIKINGLQSWNQNPWVWVIEFEVIQKNISELI